MPTQAELDLKRNLVLDHETAFANQIGSAVFEKPSVNLWMILLPILFLHLIYRMKKYKEGRTKFNEDFMLTRRRAMETAVKAVANGAEPDIDKLVGEALLSDELKEPYTLWMHVLVEYYMDLLAANGDDLESLVRSAYGRSANYLLALNRLGAAERQFYAAIKPTMEETEGAAAVITAIEERSHQLRREFAESIFAGMAGKR